MKKKKPFLVAEISANHNGSLKQAKKLVDTAKKYGADAVKIQTYEESTMTINSDKKIFRIKSGLWRGQTFWSLYKKAKTPFSWQKSIFSYARKKRIICFSTPFDIKAVELLEKLKCPIYKIASFEITDLPLIARVAKTKKPIIISTGLANLREISRAYKTAKKNGAKDITLLYCVSNYPANLEDFNLNNILILKKKFKCKIGLSDHSRDNRVAISATCLGAEIFEKHIALEKQKKGFDIDFSLKGKEILQYRRDIDETYKLLGKKKFERKKSEVSNNIIFRRSIFVTDNLKIGDQFSNNNLKSLRPRIGLEPSYLKFLVGKRVKKNIKYGTPITKSLLKKII